MGEYEEGQTLVVNYNGALLTVAYVKTYPFSRVIHVKEPDGHEFAVGLDAVIQFTNRQTIETLENLLETMKIQIR